LQRNILSLCGFHSKKKGEVDKHRRIYVGEVPEIEETGDPRNPYQSVTEIPDEDGSYIEDPPPNPNPNPKGQPASITTRRNSLSAQKKWPKKKVGKTGSFVNNLIISSRVSSHLHI
jgi:hypothetical protein